MTKKATWKTMIGHIAVGAGFILTVGLTMKGYGKYAEIGWYIFVFGMGYNWGYDNGRFENHDPKTEAVTVQKPKGVKK